MKRLHLNLISAALLALALCSCHKLDMEADDPAGNFEALWTIIDEHYCFFAEKNVDWDAVYVKYQPRISDEMTYEELFDVCADMINELHDGHTNLSSGFNTSYYRKWWSDYPQNYSARLIEQSYFNFNYRSTSGITYGYLTDNVGYMRYSSFATPVGEGNLDNILYYLRTASGLVIDIRDNGGGDLTNVETLVARFIDDPIVAGSISHKTGPGHNDFSQPYTFTYQPAAPGRIRWTKPIIVLTNRSTYSAANNFASIMKLLPQVKIVGATTGGGSGIPYSSELPCGWSIRFSACPIYDSNGVCAENGVEPTEGCAINLDPQQALLGHDTILDLAIKLISDQK